MQAFRIGLSVARLAPRLAFREYATIVPRTTTSNLSPIPASRHKQKRLGRGPSSGLGGTSTRGHKGQKARSGNGKPKAGFEGGQTPISRRFPKRGFYNQNVKVWAPINLDRIQHWINQGRLTSSPETPITVHHLYKSGCIHDVSDGAKLLADGANQLTSAIHLEVSRASKKAIHAVEKLGGTVVCKYYNDLSLKDCVDDRTDRKAAAPIRKNDILWYTNSQNRGYLSPFILRDTKGMQEEKDARVAQATLRKTQAKHAFPVFKLSDMKQLPQPLKL